MRISHKLRFIMVLPLILAVAVAAIFVYSARRIREAVHQADLATDLEQGVFELNILTYDYLQHSSDRSRQQWFLKHKKLGRLLREVAEGFPAHQALAATSHNHHRQIREDFETVVAEGPAEGENAHIEAFRRRQVGQLLTRSQSLVSWARELVTWSEDRRSAVLRQTGWLVSSLVAGAALLISLAAALVGRGVIRPIAVLHRGTDAVGAGDLDYHIPDRADDEIGELSSAFNHMASRLKQATVSRDELAREVAERKLIAQQLERTGAELSAKNAQMMQDLNIARDVQFALLPKEYPVFPPGAAADQSALHFSHLYHPSSTVGGDFCDVQAVSGHAAGVLIGDVMGHGMRAALVTAILQGLMQELSSLGNDPGRYLTEINRALVAILSRLHEVVFATAFYVVLDAHAGRLEYACAGHPGPVWIAASGPGPRLLAQLREQRGPALGLYEDSVYRTVSYDVSVGDTVLLYTDGLTEVCDPAGREYGETQLLAAVGGHVGQDPAGLVQAVLHDVEGFADSDRFADDICLVAARLEHRLNVDAP